MNNASRNVIDFFTQRDMEICLIVNFVVLVTVISVFGMATNVINIVVFYIQGFNNTVTISLFALAISDLCSLLTALWFGICENPLFVNSDIIIYPPEIQCLTAGLPHILCVRITGWTTVFITAERCLCITLPLKIKQIVTPKRTTVIIIIIYVVIISTFLPKYATSYFDWKFIESQNRTLIGLYFTSGYYKIDRMFYFTYSTLGAASFVAVIMFTGILVVQLNRKSKWRKHASGDKDQSQSITNRERRTVTTVVMVATLLIVCYTPGVMISMVTFFEEEFGIFGVYVNSFYILWSFAFLFQSINASINIFLYYNMSMNYRDTFRVIFSSFYTDLSHS